MAKNKELKSDEFYYKSSRGSEPRLDLPLISLTKITSAKISESINSPYNEQKREIRVDFNSILKRVGDEIEIEKAVDILTNLGFIVSQNGSILDITIPEFRSDIENEQDITEEIVRIVGIDNIASKPIMLAEANRENETKIKLDKSRHFRKKASSVGFYESVSYVFSDSDICKELGFELISGERELANPITKELDTLRPSLLPNLLLQASNNIKNFQKRVALFEFGRVFDVNRDESLRLSFIFSGESQRAFVDNSAKPKPITFFSFAKMISSVIGDFEVESENLNPKLYNPYESGVIIKDGKRVGEIGRVHIEVENKFDLPATYVCEIEFDKIGFELIKFKNYSKFPPLQRDLSLLVPKEMKYAKIDEFIKSLEIENLSTAYAIDKFESEDLGENYSLTIRFVLQSEQKTLNEEDISLVMNKIIEQFDKKLGLKIR
jgi:phenylalanyl-tRNA synthetase beta chain